MRISSAITLAALTAGLLAAGNPAQAAEPAPDECGALQADYQGEGGEPRTFTGTIERLGAEDTLTVTFNSGRLSEATIEGETVNDTVYGNYIITNSNGVGDVSFLTSDGMVSGTTVTCEPGTEVSAIEGVTAAGSPFRIEG